MPPSSSNPTSTLESPRFLTINWPSDTLNTGRAAGEEPTRRSEVSPASEQEGVDMHLTSGVMKKKKTSPRDENPTQ